MLDPTPPLFDHLGEGVDVSELESSAAISAVGSTSTLKGGYRGKVRIQCICACVHTLAHSTYMYIP